MVARPPILPPYTERELLDRWRQLPYPRQRLRNPKVTIACGFRCKDGVLLCADSQITVPAYAKYAEPKIARLAGTEQAIFFTFARDVAYSRMCIELLVERLHKTESEDKNLITSLRDEGRKIHNQFHSNSLSLNALAAIHTDRSRLYRISGPCTHQAIKCDFIGCGMDVARATASSLYSPDMTLYDASLMASYALYQTKQHVDGCGKESEIVRVFDNNSYSLWEQRAIRLAERNYRQFLKASKPRLLKPIGYT